MTPWHGVKEENKASRLIKFLNNAHDIINEFYIMIKKMVESFINYIISLYNILNNI